MRTCACMRTMYSEKGYTFTGVIRVVMVVVLEGEKKESNSKSTVGV